MAFAAGVNRHFLVGAENHRTLRRYQSTFFPLIFEANSETVEFNPRIYVGTFVVMRGWGGWEKIYSTPRVARKKAFASNSQSNIRREWEPEFGKSIYVSECCLLARAQRERSS